MWASWDRSGGKRSRLRILALSVVVQSLTLLANTVCLSQGRADLQLRLTVLQRASTIVAIVPCLRWGVRGVAIAYSLATALSAWPTLSLAGRLVGLRTSAVLARAWPVFVASTAMAATVLAVDAWGAAHLQHLQALVLDVGTGVPAYWLAVWLLRVPAYHDVLGVLRPRPAKEGGL